MFRVISTEIRWVSTFGWCFFLHKVLLLVLFSPHCVFSISFFKMLPVCAMEQAFELDRVYGSAHTANMGSLSTGIRSVPALASPSHYLRGEDVLLNRWQHRQVCEVPELRAKARQVKNISYFSYVGPSDSSGRIVAWQQEEHYFNV